MYKLSMLASQVIKDLDYLILLPINTSVVDLLCGLPCPYPSMLEQRHRQIANLSKGFYSDPFLSIHYWCLDVLNIFAFLI